MTNAKREDLTVRFQNYLNAASYDLDAVDQKIFDAAAKQVLATSVQTDRFLVTAKDLAVAGITNNTSANRALKKAAEHFAEKTLTIPLKYLPEEASPEDRSGDLIFPWYDSIQLTGKGGIYIRFHRIVFPYLQKLVKNFTYYLPQETADLTSKYSLRIYKILCQWQNNHLYIDGVNKDPHGTFRIGVSAFKTLLQIKDNVLYANIRQNCLDLALKQINESKNTKLEFSYTEIKEGRTIVAIEFHILKKVGIGSGLFESKNDFWKDKNLSIDKALSIAYAWKITALDEKDIDSLKKLQRRYENFNDETFINWSKEKLGEINYRSLVSMKNACKEKGDYKEYVHLVAGIIQIYTKEMYFDWLEPLGFKLLRIKKV